MIARSRVLVEEKNTAYYPGVAAIAIIYKGTPENSPGRRLFVDFWVWIAHEGWAAKKTADDYPPEFLFDAMKSLSWIRARPTKERPWVKTPEAYREDNDKKDGDKNDRV